jgi:hypothetical protein
VGGFAGALFRNICNRPDVKRTNLSLAEFYLMLEGN